MSQDWTIEPLEAGEETGSLRHRPAPRFTARWTTGADGLAGIAGPCWTAEGSGGEDTIHIFGFRWDDPPPDQEAFDDLMRQAAAAIDAWITRRL